MVEATSVPEEPYSWDDWKRVYAVEAAIKESRDPVYQAGRMGRRTRTVTCSGRAN
jgi:hypothetical protein